MASSKKKKGGAFVSKKKSDAAALKEQGDAAALKKKSAAAAAKMQRGAEARTAAFVVPGLVVAGIALGLLAAWTAAGSVGLLGHPLRRMLVLLFLGGSLALLYPKNETSWRSLLSLLGAVVAALVAVASSLGAVNVLGVALALAMVAAARRDSSRTFVLHAALSVAAFALFRLAHDSIPTLWLLTDGFSRAFGAAAGFVAGRPLWVGPTMGGVDFLVLMLVFWAGWLTLKPGPRWVRGLGGLAAILAVHVLYLVVLSHHLQILTALSGAAAVGAEGESPSFWAASLEQFIPWNLPVLLGLAHLSVVALMLRWTAWPAEVEFARGPGRSPGARGRLRRRRQRAWIGMALLAAAAVALTTLSTGRADLSGKKIVIFKEGFLNWLKAEHDHYGRLSIGMYGWLPIYLESFGAECLVSPELAAEDLQGADALVLLFPNEPWKEGQLERIRKFVVNGGSLLVMGEHTTDEEDIGGARFNDVLEGTGLHVRFDSATFTVGGWLQSYQALAHPITTGIPDDRNQFGSVIGASVRARWPARPLLIGKWGWADPGNRWSGAAMMGNHHYDPGEQLGDLILAAEQNVGKGRILAFGDTSTLTNGINTSSHIFTSRLFAYLTGGASNPQAMWRQVLGFAALLGLALLLFWLPEPEFAIGFSLATALLLTATTAWSAKACIGLPDGRKKTPNNLAYINAANVSVAASESWRPDGTMGLAMNLMRNGYLTLYLPELTAERLSKAELFVSIAPSRPYSRKERKVVREYVEQGGIFITTVGFDEYPYSKALLDDFGFGFQTKISGVELGEVKPFGHYKAPYIDLGGEYAFVRFNAAWPIFCSDPKAQALAYGGGDVPVILVRRVERGLVVLVGDTGFAMNKNLEHEGGQPFEGQHENAEFWRWLIGYLTERPAWTPAKKAKPEAPALVPPPATAPTPVPALDAPTTPTTMAAPPLDASTTPTTPAAAP